MEKVVEVRGTVYRKKMMTVLVRKVQRTFVFTHIIISKETLELPKAKRASEKDLVLPTLLQNCFNIRKRVGEKE